MVLGFEVTQIVDVDKLEKLGSKIGKQGYSNTCSPEVHTTTKMDIFSTLKQTRKPWIVNSTKSFFPTTKMVNETSFTF